MSKKLKINEQDKLITIKKIYSFQEETELTVNEIVNIVLNCWNDIFTISNKNGSFIIGDTVFPKPQIMGFILETLISQKIENLYPNKWTVDPTGYSKDLTYKLDDSFSLEIKTSSSKGRIYGNRSYTKQGTTSKKSKNSFYLAVNFEKFNTDNLKEKPKLTKIRLGYLEQSDWIGQNAQTGQNASLSAIDERSKLLELWPHRDELLLE